MSEAIPNNVSHLSAADRRSVAERAAPFYRKEVSGDNREGRPVPGKFVAKGHDAQLQDAQFGKIPVRITTMSGVVLTGTVTKRDKFTITLQHASGDYVGYDEILYKHAIEGVMLLRSEFKKAA